MVIHYKDKKNSSGVIRDGQIILYISSRLPKAIQAEHIATLTRRLEAQLAAIAARQNAGGLPDGLQPGPALDPAALQARAEELNRRFYGFRLRRVAYRRQESRWGSCSRVTGNIQISHRLQGAPLELLDYVLIHEICHLKEFNHGPRFWALVEQGCPEWQRRRRQLRQYGEWLAVARM